MIDEERWKHTLDIRDSVKGIWNSGNDIVAHKVECKLKISNEELRALVCRQRQLLIMDSSK